MKIHTIRKAVVLAALISMQASARNAAKIEDVRDVHSACSRL